MCSDACAWGARLVQPPNCKRSYGVLTESTRCSQCGPALSGAPSLSMGLGWAEGHLHPQRGQSWACCCAALPLPQQPIQVPECHPLLAQWACASSAPTSPVIWLARFEQAKKLQSKTSCRASCILGKITLLDESSSSIAVAHQQQ